MKNRDESPKGERQPKEFWIVAYPTDFNLPPSLDALTFKPPEFPSLHVREVLDSDKTPEQVIEAVCNFLRTTPVGDGAAFTLKQVAAGIEADKDRILGHE